MCLEEVGLQSAEGRGFEKDEIGFSRWEVLFLNRSSAGVEQKAQCHPADRPQPNGLSVGRLRVK